MRRGDGRDDLLTLYERQCFPRIILGSHHPGDLVVLHHLVDDPFREEAALGVVKRRVVLDLLLEVRLVRELPAEDEAFVDAGEDHVPVVDRVLHLVLLVLEGGHEGARRRLDYREVDSLLLVDVLDERVDLLPVDHRVHVGEVIAEGHDDVLVAQRVVRDLLTQVYELVGLPLTVVALEGRVRDEWVVRALQLVDGEHVGPPVRPPEYVRQDLLAVALIAREWLPKESLRLVRLSAALWLVQHVVEELGLEAKVGEEGLCCCRVAVDAHVPGHSRAHAEFLLEELVTELNIEDKVLVVRQGLIRRYQASLSEFDLAILNNLLDFLLSLWVLL